MAFHFVNSTPEDTAYSAETRRRIRSQAMRDYRRRQRDEDLDIGSSPELSPPSSLASPTLSSQSRSREDSQRRESGPQSLSVQPDLLRRHSSGTSSDNPPPAHRTAKRRSPQSPLENEQSRSSQRRRRRQEAPRAQHGVFSQFMIHLPKRSTCPSEGNDVEATSSPERLERMLQICDDYNAWLLPCIAAENPSTEDNQACDSKTSQLLLSAFCLTSIGHLEAVRSVEAKPDENVLKTSVLALLNKRLKNASEALQNDTIGALACLASYEMSQGSSEATMHLTGLQQIIKLRGGMREIGSTAGLSMLLEILDLAHAVCCQTTPMYTSAEASQPSSKEETPAPPSRSDASGQLDQAMLDDISNFILSIPDLAETGEEVPAPDTTRKHVVTPRTFDDEVERWRAHLSEPAQGSAAREDYTRIAYACQLAEQLHLLTTCAVQAHPTQILAKAEELFRAVNDMSDDAWDAVPGLHARVLLTALSASTASISSSSDHAPPAQKSWFHAHLTRRLYRTPAEDWTGVKGMVLRFIEMQRAARRPRGAQAVRAVVRGVDMEIVLDGLEAEGKGMRVI